MNYERNGVNELSRGRDGILKSTGYISNKSNNMSTKSASAPPSSEGIRIGASRKLKL